MVFRVALFGSGPAGLMAASRLHTLASASKIELEIHLFERRPGLGRKLLIAGSSGLNISYDTPLQNFITHYTGWTPEVWNRLFTHLTPYAWIKFVESLGLETFSGTSSRFFVKEMKASGLLKAWTDQLKEQGVIFHPSHEWKSFDELKAYDASAFFLGGGSWEDHTPVWIQAFKDAGLKVHDFYATNVGFELDWSAAFLKEAEGKPLKNILFTNRKGEKAGELMVTNYGLEGTPIYFLGQAGEAFLDLKPGLTLEEIKSKLRSVKENLSPIRRVKKMLSLCDASLALLFHYSSAEEKADIDRIALKIKRFSIHLKNPRPLKESISSGGGLDLSEVSTESGSELMLKKYPGVFCGGEMLDWNAPTGGFLIQASVTQGAVVANSLLNFLRKKL